MKNEPAQKVTIILPHRLYNSLRFRAKKQDISLPDFIQQRLQLRPDKPSNLADLPLKKILTATCPEPTSPDSRLDFYSR